MRNIIIMAFALVLGASANADHHGFKVKGCKSAQKFLEKTRSQLDALFDASAEGDLKTMQDLGKMKLDLLDKLANSDTPYCPACSKIARQLNKIAFVVSIMRAKMEKPTEDASPTEAQTTPTTPSTLLPEPSTKPSSLIPAKNNRPDKTVRPKTLKLPSVEIEQD